MPNGELNIHWKTLDDTLIASIRFVGQFDEISKRFGELVEGVGPHISGKAFTLYRGGNPKTGYDVEVCFPVSQLVEKGDIKSRVLEGEDVVCTIHRGPYRSDDEDKGIGATWGKLWRYSVEHHIGIAENACREIYLEDDMDHGDDSGKYVTEIMMPLLLPKWLARFENSLDEFAGNDVRRDVLEGSENLTSASDTDDKIA
ncbi:MAG: GyrI-like domain-containing protein, partial [Actinomycetota bacterium]|nr:GyrI-like domain-containing protein [Actinomycetota bacterium]